jgi:hypothetical protein
MLQQALGTDLIQVSALRQKVLEQCSPARAIVVEYTLAPSKGSEPAESAAASAPPRRFSSSSVAEAGGRTFDLEVDILDPSSFEIVDEVNKSTEADQATDAVLAQMAPKIQYLARCVMRESFNVFPLEEGLGKCGDMAIDPLGVGAEAYKMNDMFRVISTRQETLLPDKLLARPDPEQASASAAAGGSGGGGTILPTTSAVVAKDNGGAGAGAGAGAVGKDGRHIVNVFEDIGLCMPSAVHSYRGYIDVASDVPFRDIVPPKTHTQLNLRSAASLREGRASDVTATGAGAAGQGGGKDSSGSGRESASASSSVVRQEDEISWVRKAAKILLPPSVQTIASAVASDDTPVLKSESKNE